MTNVVIRTDSSAAIGIGHVARCLTLANVLRESGALVSFVCREHEGNACDLIEKSCFRINRLPLPHVPGQCETSPAHAAWIGALWHEDAQATKAAIAESGARVDWLIVDHYGLDRRWESALRASVDRIVVIDDLADRTHDCDILLDQNLVAGMYERYKGKLPAACRTLLGPGFALLQPVYSQLHAHVRPRSGKIQRILISFGGADNANLTGRALEAILRVRCPQIVIDVVIAASSAHALAVQRLAVQANVHVHSGLSTLAPLIAQSDLAIGGSGVTNWERLCLGLPALVVTLADNQIPIAEELHRRGLVRLLGHCDDVTVDTISAAVSELLRSGLDETWSTACAETVDGEGVKRVQAVMLLAANSAFRARHADAADEALLLEWANDPTTRRSSFHSEPISAVTHHEWFTSRMSDDACRLYIVEAENGVPFGQVRFERHADGWEIHYSMAPPFRGLGFGRKFLQAALQQLLSHEPSTEIYGQVKCSNQPSRRLFESLGFRGELSGSGETLVYRRSFIDTDMAQA